MLKEKKKDINILNKSLNNFLNKNMKETNKENLEVIQFFFLIKNIEEEGGF